MELKYHDVPPSKEQEGMQMTRLLLHLDAAYSLARWLTGNELDAEDVVQEAYLRAFSYFASFQGGDGKGWLLTIVRNTYYSRLKRNRVHEQTESLDEEIHVMRPDPSTPETLALYQQRECMLRGALNDLPTRYRKVLLLRVIKDLSYQEIANKVGVPIGTVMSRLSRARKRLHRDLVCREEARVFVPEQCNVTNALDRHDKTTFHIEENRAAD
jgi:RNA polymerase sigma-70 factor, ECF subfamily